MLVSRDEKHHVNLNRVVQLLESLSIYLLHIEQTLLDSLRITHLMVGYSCTNRKLGLIKDNLLIIHESNEDFKCKHWHETAVEL